MSRYVVALTDDQRRIVVTALFERERALRALGVSAAETVEVWSKIVDLESVTDDAPAAQ